MRRRADGLRTGLWWTSAVFSLGAQVGGAEECSASMDPAVGCGVMTVIGPISLLLGITGFVLWRRGSAIPLTARRPRLRLLWSVTLVVTLLPLIWLRVARVL